MKNKNILLIAYKFPPYSEVGAYRWSKLCKYLSKKGYKIFVVTLKWNIKNNQSWLNDITNNNIEIHRINSCYIHNLRYKKFKNNFTGKILNKIRNQILKIMNLFYFIDEAQYWGFILLPYCLKLIIKNKIKYVIATGAPYMANYWAAKLKMRKPDIKLVQDLRDEWNESRKFNFKLQKILSENKEKFALNNCDAVVTVSKGLYDLYSKKIFNKNIKMNIIYNGYDEDNIRKIKYKNIKKDFSIIYAGSLSNGRDKVLDRLLIVIKNKHAELKGIKIKLFINNYESIKSKYKYLINNNILILNDLVSQERLFEEINKSFIALHLMPDSQIYIVSIKLFEYGMLKRPILSLNKGGDTDYIIKKHKLGISVNYNNDDEIFNMLKKYFKIWEKNPKYSSRPVKLNDYSYRNLSKKYEKLLNSL